LCQCDFAALGFLYLGNEKVLKKKSLLWIQNYFGTLLGQKILSIPTFLTQIIPTNFISGTTLNSSTVLIPSHNIEIRFFPALVRALGTFSPAFSHGDAPWQPSVHHSQRWSVWLPHHHLRHHRHRLQPAHCWHLQFQLRADPQAEYVSGLAAHCWAPSCQQRCLPSCCWTARATLLMPTTLSARRESDAAVRLTVLVQVEVRLLLPPTSA
jgi:hypothetical protein